MVQDIRHRFSSRAAEENSGTSERSAGGAKNCAFYKLRAIGPAWQLLPTAALGTWALVVNGTFFAAVSLRTRSREIMLPLLLFPISIPAIVGMVNATSSILTGDYSARIWIVLLLTYDVIFTSASLLLFETVLNAE